MRNAKREKDGEMNERISKHMYNTLKITQVECKRRRQRSKERRRITKWHVVETESCVHVGVLEYIIF